MKYRLPASTLAHLQAFLAEKQAREEKFAAIAARAERDHRAMMARDAVVEDDTSAPPPTTTALESTTTSSDPTKPTEEDADIDITMDLFTEDWQLSQFWYDIPTRDALAYEISFGDNGFRVPSSPTTTTTTTTTTSPTQPQIINIAIVSAPSVFAHLLNLQSKGLIPPHIHPILLEHDPRFHIFNPPPHSPLPPRFHMYDFNTPLLLPPHLQHTFDAVLVDPPFLSEDCQTGAAVTVRWLLKKEEGEGAAGRVVVCTGERVARVVERLYGREGVRETDFEVVHENNLSNPFRCLANYEGGRWRWVARGGEKEKEGK
ncbi:putative N6-adenine methyltransferase-domain-containing protein [Peziza echinospora]|nr:putative N6-adenine methyltransferase-domain-containing protein [Peziza echinospora]